MEKDKLKEAVTLFRQLSPQNQKYFLMMVRAAEAGEKNAMEACVKKMNSILQKKET